jgi:hypothetical protein
MNRLLCPADADRFVRLTRVPPRLDVDFRERT